MATSSSLIIIGWKIAIMLFGTIALLSGLVKDPGFWSSYVLDIVGPAWNYILLRGLYTSNKSTFMSLKFTPETAAFIIFGTCVLVKTTQYFKLYNAHFDPYDYLAYGSLLLPCYLLDKYLLNRFHEADKC